MRKLGRVEEFGHLRANFVQLQNIDCFNAQLLWRVYTQYMYHVPRYKEFEYHLQSNSSLIPL